MAIVAATGRSEAATAHVTFRDSVTGNVKQKAKENQPQTKVKIQKIILCTFGNVCVFEQAGTRRNKMDEEDELRCSKRCCKHTYSVRPE